MIGVLGGAQRDSFENTRDLAGDLLGVKCGRYKIAALCRSWSSLQPAPGGGAWPGSCAPPLAGNCHGLCLAGSVEWIW
jgi:hypothetical protein